MGVFIDGKNILLASSKYHNFASKKEPRVPFDVKTARAFTVKPAWGWLIMQGIKDVENRSITVLPPKGVCVVTFSKSYTRTEHEDILDSLPRDSLAKKIPDYESLKKLCGKAVGIVNYDVLETSSSPWYNQRDIPWKITSPRWFARPFIATGFVGMWRMKINDARKALRQMQK